jgi:hypothetical protein
VAQHDYVIANGTGAAVRSDLNDALAAIVSNNSDTTEPSPTYAYMWWADTSTGLLKLRNGANNAWITLRQLDGDFTTVSVDNGSNSAPSIYFNASGTDTGIYSSGTDAVDITTAGTRRFGVASGGDVTIYGGNVTINAQGDLRFADSDSSNWVAFQSPATVASNVTWTLPAADGTTGQVLSTNGSGTLSWASATGTSDKISEGNTEAEVVDTGSDGHFKVTTEGTERLRVDPLGRLLVGTSTSVATGGSAATTQIFSNSTGEFLSLHLGFAATASPIFTLSKSRNTTYGSYTIVQNNDSLGRIYFAGDDGTDYNTVGASIEAQVDGTPGTNDMPGRLVFSTTADGASSPTERMRITNLGVLKQSTTGTYLSTTARYNEFSNLNATSGDINTYFTLGANTSDTSSIFIYCFQSGVGGKMVVYGNGNIQNANNSYGALSDIKLKENIVDANSQWDDIKALQVRNYNLKEGQTHTQIGLVAQEVEPVSPGLVYESPDRDAEGNDLGTVTKSVNYSVLYMKAVKALQEAMERIEQLETEMAAVKAQLS